MNAGPLLAWAIEENINRATLSNPNDPEGPPLAYDEPWHAVLVDADAPDDLIASDWAGLNTEMRGLLLLRLLRDSNDPAPPDLVFEVLAGRMRGNYHLSAVSYGDVARHMLDEYQNAG